MMNKTDYIRIIYSRRWNGKVEAMDKVVTNLKKKFP